jgi:hypothetical protein
MPSFHARQYYGIENQRQLHTGKRLSTHQGYQREWLSSARFMQIRLPGEVERAMIRGVRAREIPFYRVMSGQRMLQYGQGKYGRHFMLTSSENESHTGTMLQFSSRCKSALRIGQRMRALDKYPSNRQIQSGE